MTPFEQTIVDRVSQQKRYRECEAEGAVYPIEKDLTILQEYNAISLETLNICLEILRS
jgi:hypothetical protein